MKKTDREKKNDEKRLKSFLIAQMEVEIKGRCTIMGRTFTRNDLGYINKRISMLKREEEENNGSNIIRNS